MPIHRIAFYATAPLLTLSALAACGGETGTAPPQPPVAPSAPAIAVATPQAPAETVPRGPLPTDARPTHERLDLVLDPEAERFSGTASIDVTLDRPRDVVWLHGRGLAVKACEATLPTGEHLTATWSEVDPGGVARVSLPHAIAGAATITIRYDAAYDSTLVGVYRARVAEGHAVFSKFEAIYARRAFPCFDEPAFKVPFDVTLTVPKDAVALGNMPPARVTDGGATKTVTFQTTPPLPTYLVAFAVGPFAAATASIAPSPLRRAPMPVVVNALRGREAQTAFAAEVTPRLLAEEERYYGVAFPYPKLDLLAVPDFQSGAMENAGLITFRDSALLVDPKAASLGQRIRVTSTIAHEAAHQWFGDLVTMKWWDDLWLNESFASFLGRRTMRVVTPEYEEELTAVEDASGVMNADGLAATRRIRQPIASTDDITNAFDGITYEKGEAVLSMVEGFVGEEAFRKGLHEYLTAHAGGNATTADLVDALSKASGKNLAPLFASFLDQPGVPLLATRATCDDKKGAIAITQSRWIPLGSAAASGGTWNVPVCVRAGVAGKVVEACGVLEGHEGTIALPGCADWFLPNADARGYYRFTEEGHDLAKLREHAKLLTTAERMALARDLDAAYRSASLPAADVLRAMEPLARDAHGAVATEAIDVYRSIAERALMGAPRAKLEAYTRRLYSPTAKALGWRASKGETTWTSIERKVVLRLLAMRLGDRTVLAEGAKLGRAYLGIGADGALHPELVDPDLTDLATAAAVREAAGDARVFDTVSAALAKSDDSQKRSGLLGALASTRDRALVQRALDLALDPGLRKNERLGTIFRLLDDEHTRDAAWAWLQTHFDALVPMLPDRYAGYVPPRLGFCDATHASEVQAFFAPRVPSLTGGTRNLAQAVEAMQSCAKVAETQRASAEAFAKGL